MGGICTPEYFKNGYTLYLNSGLSSSRNHYGQRWVCLKNYSQYWIFETIFFLNYGKEDQIKKKKKKKTKTYAKNSIFLRCKQFDKNQMLTVSQIIWETV